MPGKRKEGTSRKSKAGEGAVKEDRTDVGKDVLDGALASDPALARKLLMNMPYGLLYGKILTDDDGKPVDLKYLDMNRAYEQILGMDKQQALGRLASEVFPRLKEGISNWISPYVRAAMDGETTSFDRLWPINSRWYRISVFGSGKGYFTAITEDINEQKTSEEAVKTERNRLNQAQRVSHTGSWDWDVQ